MSYLLQLVRRRDSVTPAVARVDEHLRLNRPGLDPGFVLQIADCMNTINLEFSVDSAELSENALFKIDTLLGALQRFRDGLAAEVELARHR